MADNGDTTSMEIYKTLFETWRSQVNSYWQRSNYFAVFETAALAGCWSLMEHGHLWMGLFGAGLGICLTIVWWSSNSTVHSYVVYWWEAIKAIEHKLLLQNDGLDFVSRHSGSGRWPRYSHLVQIVRMDRTAGIQDKLARQFRLGSCGRGNGLVHAVRRIICLDNRYSDGFLLA
jgi:hypothetical protein